MIIVSILAIERLGDNCEYVGHGKVGDNWEYVGHGCVG